MVLVNRTGGYRRWPTRQAFYDQRGGERSGEGDFGVHNWANPLAYRATSNDRWRVSVVEETGDVYAFDNNSRDVLLLGTVVPTDGDSVNANRINARLPREMTYPATYCAAERLFKGWANNPGSLGRPLHWFAERLAAQQGVK